MQLASVAPSSASSLSKQVLQRKKFKTLGEHEANCKVHKQDKVKLLRYLAPPLVAAVLALSPISNPPVSVGQTLDVQKGATLFRRACIGCHGAGGNIIQPGATLFLKDLQRKRTSGLITVTHGILVNKISCVLCVEMERIRKRKYIE